VIELRGTDPKKNQFTVNLYFDDKRTERRDKAINEPVYFYVQGASSALQLVVNKLGRDSISGYIRTPKGFFPNTPHVLTPRSAQGEAEKVLPPGAVRENPKDGLKYVWIPPGTFMMGCSPGDSECDDNEKPSHQVAITKGFWLGQTEVTVGAYKRFARETGRAMPEAPNFNRGWGNEQMPVVNVGWDDAVAYCGWAGGRLPTEAEWEYAARAGSTEACYGPLDDIAWYDRNSGGRTHEVGQKRPNAFNLYDMLGNVWEWVSDWYDKKYYTGSPERDPRGPGQGEDRVFRGGSWYGFPRGARVSDRVRYVPAYWNDDVGVRCGGEVVNP
jgi:formylglycine-generating enzyme required for sulfatase activity